MIRFIVFVILAISIPVIAGPAPASFAYILQADSFAKSKAAAVARLAASDRDWIVLDSFYTTGTPWRPADLAAIRGGRPGRKVIAYLSIGEAEDYRPYWKESWGKRGKLTDNIPSWLAKPNPDWPGNYRVKYWDPRWQKIMLKALDRAMADGFDGVYLDIVDAFEGYEQKGGEFIDDRPNTETHQSYRRDMMDWVKVIAARARATNPGALVIPQNGSQLLAQRDFLDIVSAIGIEDLFTHGDRLQPDSHSKYIMSYLEKIAAAGKPVLVIEYAKSAKRQAAARKRAEENGFVWLVTDRMLTTLGKSGK